MTPAKLIDQAKADGVQMLLTPSGRLKLSGDQNAIERWLGTVGQYSSQIIASYQCRPNPGLWTAITFPPLCRHHPTPAGASWSRESA